MLKICITYLLLIFKCCLVYSQKSNDALLKTRISVSPVLSLYQSNPKHTNSTRPKMAFNIAIKGEIGFGKKRQSSVLFGAEYMSHGVSFNSYYFYSDSIRLYTPSRLIFGYNLKIYELNFPIQLKYSFQKESNSKYTNYVFGGYNLRWLLPSQLKVSGNGSELVNKPQVLTFKIPVVSSQLNSFLTIGTGFQRNSFSKKSAVFLECQFKYGLSPIYLTNSFTASSLYINTHFLLITVGIKI